MSRSYNFSAGPAMLPRPVIDRIRDDLPEYDGTGASVMELSHRGGPFKDIAARAEERLRDLLHIGDDFKVLFLQGGATTQFVMAPMNLLREGESADYVLTGNWGKKSHREADRIARVRVAADAGNGGYTSIPDRSGWELDPDAGFLHYTANETVGGVEFHDVPDVDAPLVADMSSNFLSRPVDVDRFGLIYAGAQKNFGPAGLCVVIIRSDMLERSRDDLPAMLSYRTQVERGSMFNTPNTFAWYVAGLVFDWLKEQGGVAAMEKRNREKAALLYDAIDASDFYHNPVDKPARSTMNVPFTLAEPDLDEAFLEQAAKQGLTTLKGHRSVGGMRASLYNAMPLAGVEALVDFMRDFEQRMT